MNRLRRGFTLVEMMVIAPIVILLIGSFIALIVNLTGEVLSSRGSNTMTYDLQDALNRIEEDVKLSTTYLSVNNIPLTATKQGYGTDINNGSTVNFTNVAKSGGSNASLILNGLVTNGNPMSTATGLVYLANKPNSCSTLAVYSQNTPMTMNIVYFVDGNNTLWRRVLMRSDYAAASIRCGSAAPWQQPSCIVGYNPSTMPFCKTNDVRLMDGIKPSDFIIQYFPSADSTVADPTASNPSITNDAVRNTALQSNPTVTVSITARKNIAGRDITGSGSIRVTRLDTNASSIAIDAPPTAAPSAPVVSSTVANGHEVTFTWPRVSTATSYDLEYRINGGAWQSKAASTGLDNNNRSYTVTDGTHTDTVEARVHATNSFGDSAFGTTSLAIPLWAPLVLKGNWTDFGQGYTTAAYTKTKAGVVMLKGLVKNGTSTIGALPADYRPEKAIMFAASSNQAIARLDIQSNGDVIAIIGDGAWFSLDGIAFMPSGTTFTNFVYQNGWTTWDAANWNPAGYALDGVGRVHLRGLIKGGATTPGSAITSVPAAILAPEYTHWIETNNNTYGHLSSIPTSSTIAAKTGASTQYNSFSAMYYTGARVDGSTCTTQWCTLGLTNGWAYTGSPFSTPRYTKASDGIVSLKGLISAGSNANMATIPAGYCPAQRMLLPVVSADVWGRVDIIPQGNGTCIISGISYNTAWVSLDSIRYVAE
jgi:Tfp pilus assembly protein PilE